MNELTTPSIINNEKIMSLFRPITNYHYGSNDRFMLIKESLIMNYDAKYDIQELLECGNRLNISKNVLIVILNHLNKDLIKPISFKPHFMGVNPFNLNIFISSRRKYELLEYLSKRLEIQIDFTEGGGCFIGVERLQSNYLVETTLNSFPSTYLRLLDFQGVVKKINKLNKKIWIIL